LLYNENIIALFTRIIALFLLVLDKTILSDDLVKHCAIIFLR